MLKRRVVRLAVAVCGAAFAVACASGPRRGRAEYAYDVAGAYTGRLSVEGELFEARLELRAAPGESVRGTFRVSAPFEVEGRASGAVVDDLLRLTLAYETSDRVRCDGRIEGILTLARGGEVIEGPVTVTDCEGSLAGSVSFRR